MSVFWLILAILIWGVIHSVLASLEAKGVFARWLGTGFMRFYRFLYNLFSLVTFLPVLALTVILPDQMLYSIPFPWSLAALAVQLIAGVLLVVGLLQTDTLSFVGLRQILEPQPAPSRLVSKGLYHWVRHPLYSAGLLFIWLTPSVSLNTFVLYLSLSVYILIGAHFEERKLLDEFGQDYAEYQVATPMLIPGLKIPWMRAWQK